MKLPLAILFASLSLGLNGCTKTSEWTLFYYNDVSAPPAAPLQVDDIHGYYDTLEQCQRKALGMQRLKQDDYFGAGAYQCGHLCGLDDKSALVCKSLSQ
ncbi:hypothetical protein [Shewanella xiamenensis]|uniref:hypothetical protein n=1 Tax=Shewanella xiamenensis TaxID=332186 RepID=UPI00166322E8|nr:hypothetical protein [Shewanella xiamenensis]MCL1071447.1 hypothetical protein [Shewanella xiamenensis]WHF55963.1 hypothetical protein OCF84_01445 [Shewanella xiamenensis]